MQQIDLKTIKAIMFMIKHEQLPPQHQTLAKNGEALYSSVPPPH